MRYRTVAIFALLCWLPLTLLAKSFEGTVTYESTGGGREQPITFQIKGDRMAFTPEGIPGGGRVILDFDEDKLYVVMDSQRMYMTTSLDAAEAEADQSASESGSIERTGETRDILGYKAEKVLYTDEDGTTESWLTEELGSFMAEKGPFADNIPADFKEAFPEGAFLLELKHPAGGLRATSIEEGEVSKEALAVPSGYRSINMPGGMNIPGLGGGKG